MSTKKHLHEYGDEHVVGAATKDKVAAQLGEAIKGLNRVPGLERRLARLEEALALMESGLKRYAAYAAKINVEEDTRGLLHQLLFIMEGWEQLLVEDEDA